MTFIGRLLAHQLNGYIACALNGFIACALNGYIACALDGYIACALNGYIACALNGYIACACVFFLVSFTQLLECYPFFSSPISSQQPSILGLQWTLMPHYSTRNEKVYYKTTASFQFFTTLGLGFILFTTSFC